jgi:hypothetical protein
MLRSAGFRITDHPEAEVYICQLAEASHDALPRALAQGVRS